MDSQRREFLKICPAVAVALLAPGVLWSCSTDTESSGDEVVDSTEDPDSGVTLSGTSLIIDLSKQADLGTVGGAVKLRATGFNGGESFIVVQTVSGTYKAMTAVCSHQQGALQLPTSGTTVTCARHSAQFSISNSTFGNNTSPPTTGGTAASLTPFTVTLDSNANTLTLTA